MTLRRSPARPGRVYHFVAVAQSVGLFLGKEDMVWVRCPSATPFCKRIPSAFYSDERVTGLHADSTSAACATFVPVAQLDQEHAHPRRMVARSSRAGDTIFGGLTQRSRVPVLQSGSRAFDPRSPHHFHSSVAQSTRAPISYVGGRGRDSHRCYHLTQSDAVRPRRASRLRAPRTHPRT